MWCWISMFLHTVGVLWVDESRGSRSIYCLVDHNWKVQAKITLQNWAGFLSLAKWWQRFVVQLIGWHFCLSELSGCLQAPRHKACFVSSTLVKAVTSWGSSLKSEASKRNSVILWKQDAGFRDDLIRLFLFGAMTRKAQIWFHDHLLLQVCWLLVI